jgi:hypothetical protein
VVFKTENGGRVIIIGVGIPSPTLDAITETTEVKTELGTNVRETRPPGPTTIGTVRVPSM